MERSTKWWHVAVEYPAVIDDESGKQKMIKEEVFVKAVDPTDVQVQVTKDLNEAGVNEFEFKKLQPTKVMKILVPEDMELND